MTLNIYLSSQYKTVERHHLDTIKTLAENEKTDSIARAKKLSIETNRRRRSVPILCCLLFISLFNVLAHWQLIPLSYNQGHNKIAWIKKCSAILTCFWKQNDKTGATLTRLIKWKSHQLIWFILDSWVCSGMCMSHSHTCSFLHVLVKLVVL